MYYAGLWSESTYIRYVYFFCKVSKSDINLAVYSSRDWTKFFEILKELLLLFNEKPE